MPIRTLLLLAFLPLLSFSCLLLVLSTILSVDNVVTIALVLLGAFVVYFCGVILYYSMAEKKSVPQMIKNLLKRSSLIR